MMQNGDKTKAQISREAEQLKAKINKLEKAASAEKQTRGELALAKQELENIFHTIGQPIMILDTDHNILKVNKETLNATGRSEKELIGLKCYRVMHGKNHPPKGCPLEKMLATQQLETSEMEIEALDRTYQVTCTPLLNKTGKVNKIIHAASDITERKLAEDNLRNNKITTESLLSAARAIPTKQTFQEAARSIFNAAKESIGAESGYVALLSKDKKMNELLFLDSGGRPCTVNPNLPMPVRGLREQAYGKGIPVWENNFAESEWQNFMPEGHAKLDNVMFAPIMSGGAALGTIGLANKPGGFDKQDAQVLSEFADIAAIGLRFSRNQESLRENEEKLQKILNESIDGVSITDEKGRIVLWNKALEKITGIHQKAVLKKNIWDVQFKLLDQQDDNPQLLSKLKLSLVDFLKTGDAP